MFEKFREAIGTGEVLRIVYDGGSSPGAIRDIIALAILDDGKVHAKCLNTLQAKTFVLSKMRLSDSAIETYDSTIPRRPGYSNLAEAFGGVAPEIRGLGWHVQIEDEDRGGQCLSAHRVTRTGRTMKGSFASLTFTPMQWDLVVMPDGRIEETNVRLSIKPFTVRAKLAKSSPSFGDLDKAVARFMDAVRAMPPEPAGK
jgi:hypothetical protein